MKSGPTDGTDRDYWFTDEGTPIMIVSLTGTV